jgi:acyl carrier protein
MTETEQQIRAFLSEAYQVRDSDVDRDTPLFSSGLLDSFAMVELVSFVERLVKTRVRARDVTLENFDSIGRIVAYLGRAAP